MAKAIVRKQRRIVMIREDDVGDAVVTQEEVKFSAVTQNFRANFDDMIARVRADAAAEGYPADMIGRLEEVLENPHALIRIPIYVNQGANFNAAEQEVLQLLLDALRELERIQARIEFVIREVHTDDDGVIVDISERGFTP